MILLTLFLIYSNRRNQIPLTSPDELRLAELAVTVADGVHVVLVELTAACVGEVTYVVWGPALGHFACAVFSRRHIVEGVVGGLPVEDDHIAGAIVNSLRKSWSAGDCGNETGNQTLMYSYWVGSLERRRASM